MKYSLHYIKISFLISIAFLLFFLSCKEHITNNPEEKNLVSGTLVDEQGNPVPAAKIKLLLNSNSSVIAIDSTDEDGYFIFSHFQQDINSLNIQISHKDFITFNEKLSDFKSKATKPFLLLHQDSCGGLLRISTFKSLDSAALSDVEIRIFRDNNLIRKAFTKDGSLIFEHLCPGKYILRAFKYNYKLIYYSFEIASSDTIITQFYFSSGHSDSCCNGKLTITVKDSSNMNNIANASVNLYSNNENIASKTTDSNGIVIFTDLCAGNYYININKHGYNSRGFPNIQLNCNDTLNDTKYLAKQTSTDTCCTASLNIHVYNGNDSSSVPDAKIYIFKTGANTITGSTNQNGDFSAYHLCAPGTYTVKATKDGYTFNYYTISFTKCDTLNVKLSIKPVAADTCCRGVIKLTVRDSVSNDLLSDAYASLSSGNHKLQSNYSNSHGVVTFTNVCKGDYSLYCYKSGYTGKSITIHMDCNDTLDFGYYLSQAPKHDTCCTAVFEAFVYDSSSSAAIPNASVMIFGNNKTIANDSTDANGNFTYSTLCAPGTYTVRVAKDGYMRKYLTVVYTTCITQKFHIGLSK